MSENDLIRRGDAIAILSAASRTAQKTIDAIAALEAAPHVNKTPKIEHDNADVLTALEPAPVRGVVMAEKLKPCPFCGGDDLYFPHGTDPAVIECSEGRYGRPLDEFINDQGDACRVHAKSGVSELAKRLAALPAADATLKEEGL